MASTSWTPFDDLDPFSTPSNPEDDPFGMHASPVKSPPLPPMKASPGTPPTRSTRTLSVQLDEVSNETFRMLRRDSTAVDSPAPGARKASSSRASDNPFDEVDTPPANYHREETMGNSDSAASDDDEGDREDDSTSTTRPTIPPRPLFAKEIIARYVQDESFIYRTEAAFLEFLTAPIPQNNSMHMKVRYVAAAKVFVLELLEPPRVLLLGHKRRDGLKALSFSSNYSISMLPQASGPIKEYTESMAQMGHSNADNLRIAKVRGNIQGSTFTVFDQGKNPTKALGAIDSRRELASIRFAILPQIYTRRAAYVVLPLPGCVVRPVNSSDTLLERAKRGDKTVLSLDPRLPLKPGLGDKKPMRRLPRVEDYMGVAEKHSIKNMMLHNPATNEILLVMGKTSQFEFRLIATYPFSPVVAFACALASCESMVRPQAQL